MRPDPRRSRLDRLPILILYPHNRCNCRCVMCDIWKTARTEQISEAELTRHVDDIQELGVEQVVFSGGEPLMHPDLFRLAHRLREVGARITLLSTGLLLRRHAAQIVAEIDEVIVSIDGPGPIHNTIRRVKGGFAMLRDGVTALREQRSGYPVSGRCTVQTANRRSLRRTVEAAESLALDKISFLAADLTSEAFNRPGGWSLDRRREIGLSRAETDELAVEVELLIKEQAGRIAAGFIVESADKLRAIVRRFQVENGDQEPQAPCCNAPWVSAVVETDGTLRPCFFHPPIGNWQEGLRRGLNSDQALAFRAGLDVASDPICRRCVCSLEYGG